MISFYTTPTFYILLAVSIVPAAILGFTEHRIKYYGLAASIVFVTLLFWGSLMQTIALVVFLADSCICTAIVYRLWKSGKKSIAKYRVCLAAVIAPLAIYKVGAVFDQNILGFIGISYLTFKSVQVLIEIRDEVITDLDPLTYFYFLIFFAPFTSGPIDRSRRFAEDANKIYTKREYGDLLSRGILLIFIGVVYQIVLATIVQSENTPHVFMEKHSAIVNILAAGKDSYAYGLYLFFDFAGYSMLAMGASYCFGIKTPRNFQAPFAALDIKDFWNRWHITLSFWLRDFLFMRLVRTFTKRKVFKNRMNNACCSYIINMFVMGAWHGLTLDYLAYGLYHGLLLAATDLFQKKSKFYKKHKNDAWFKAVSWIITINLVMFGFAIFSGQVHLILGGLIHG